MRKPNLKTCTEEQLWKYVGYHLAKSGIESVLVGGAVVAIYSKGAYRSGDLDLISKSGTHASVQKVLEGLGFEKKRGRHFEHPEGQVLKILSPTDCIRDRLASYIHFNARECLDQAVLVAEKQPFDLKKIREWCEVEGARDAFKAFKDKITKTK